MKILNLLLNDNQEEWTVLGDIAVPVSNKEVHIVETIVMTKIVYKDGHICIKPTLRSPKHEQVYYISHSISDIKYPELAILAAAYSISKGYKLHLYQLGTERTTEVIEYFHNTKGYDYYNTTHTETINHFHNTKGYDYDTTTRAVKSDAYMVFAKVVEFVSVSSTNNNVWKVENNVARYLDVNVLTSCFKVLTVYDPYILGSFYLKGIGRFTSNFEQVLLDASDKLQEFNADSIYSITVSSIQFSEITYIIVYREGDTLKCYLMGESEKLCTSLITALMVEASVKTGLVFELPKSKYDKVVPRKLSPRSTVETNATTITFTPYVDEQPLGDTVLNKLLTKTLESSRLIKNKVLEILTRVINK